MYVISRRYPTKSHADYFEVDELGDPYVFETKAEAQDYLRNIHRQFVQYETVLPDGSYHFKSNMTEIIKSVVPLIDTTLGSPVFSQDEIFLIPHSSVSIHVNQWGSVQIQYEGGDSIKLTYSQACRLLRELNSIFEGG